MENILPRVMCEYKEDMDTALSSMRMVFYVLFSGLQKVIWFILVYLFCWCEVISVRSGYPHFFSWLVTRDQLL